MDIIGTNVLEQLRKIKSLSDSGVDSLIDDIKYEISQIKPSKRTETVLRALYEALEVVTQEKNTRLSIPPVLLPVDYEVKYSYEDLKQALKDIDTTILKIKEMKQIPTFDEKNSSEQAYALKRAEIIRSQIVTDLRILEKQDVKAISDHMVAGFGSFAAPTAAEHRDTWSDILHTHQHKPNVYMDKLRAGVSGGAGIGDMSDEEDEYLGSKRFRSDVDAIKMDVITKRMEHLGKSIYIPERKRFAEENARQLADAQRSKTMYREYKAADKFGRPTAPKRLFATMDTIQPIANVNCITQIINAIYSGWYKKEATIICNDRKDIQMVRIDDSGIITFFNSNLIATPSPQFMYAIESALSNIDNVRAKYEEVTHSIIVSQNTSEFDKNVTDLISNHAIHTVVVNITHASKQVMMHLIAAIVPWSFSTFNRQKIRIMTSNAATGSARNYSCEPLNMSYFKYSEYVVHHKLLEAGEDLSNDFSRWQASRVGVRLPYSSKWSIEQMDAGDAYDRKIESADDTNSALRKIILDTGKRMPVPTAQRIKHMSSKDRILLKKLALLPSEDIVYYNKMNVEKCMKSIGMSIDDLMRIIPYINRQYLRADELEPIKAHLLWGFKREVLYNNPDTSSKLRNALDVIDKLMTQKRIDMNGTYEQPLHEINTIFSELGITDEARKAATFVVHPDRNFMNNVLEPVYKRNIMLLFSYIINKTRDLKWAKERSR
jgi:hypothetical protein